MCIGHLESHKQPFIKICNSYFNPESIDIILLKRWKKSEYLSVITHLETCPQTYKSYYVSVTVQD